MTWIAEAGVIAVALVVLAVPGGGVGWVLGLRGFSLVAAAAPLSLVAVALAAAANVALPFRWGIIPFVLSALVLMAAAFAFRRVVARVRASAPWTEQDHRGRSALVAPLAAVAVASVLLIARIAWAIAEPSNISQTFDNIYHLNAVEYVLSTGQIAPTRQLIPGFYPSLWHALTALVASLTGATVPAAVNAVSIALGGVVWPVASVFLTRQIVGNKPAALWAAAIISAGMSAFPLLMLDFGVLYPNVLSIVLLPSALGALVTVAGVGRRRLDKPTAWLLTFAWAGTMALAHPSTLMAFFGLAFWPAVLGGLRYFRSRGWQPEVRRRSILMGAVWVLGISAAATLFVRFRPTWDQAFWPPSRSFPTALFEILTNSAATGVPAIVVSVFMVVGMVAILVARREYVWLILSFLTLATVYVVGVAYPVGRLRYLLTGTWYSDMVRVAALLPAIVIPIAAIGVAAAVSFVLARLSARREGEIATPRWAALVPPLAIVVLLTAQAGPALTSASISARASYAMSEKSALLSTDEQELLERLDDEVPADAVIVGSPWTGTSLSYALAQRWALIPHIYQETDADMATLLNELNRADTDPEVCEAVQRTGATHVLDFGAREVHGATHQYEGLTDLDDSDVVRLMDEQGDAKLYEIVACG